MNSKRLVFLSFSVAVAGALCVPLAFADQRPDVSLMPIAADEPIPAVGFPPLPAKLDLPIAQATQTREYRPSKQKFGGYYHPPLPTKAAPPVSSRDAFSQPEPATYSSEQPRIEQSYQRSNESSSKQNVEPPQGIFIDQAHTQELSMPDDEQTTSGGSSRSLFSRNKQQLENNLIRRPLRPLMNLRSKFGI